MASYNTARIYSAAQADWEDWCHARSITMVRPLPRQLAAYLRHLKPRGLSILPVHLSAIASLCRSSGGSVDTKHPTIQWVMRSARVSE